jgi:hypothetical protein
MPGEFVFIRIFRKKKKCRYHLLFRERQLIIGSARLDGSQALVAELLQWGSGLGQFLGFL